jgi:hypothetical protein
MRWPWRHIGATRSAAASRAPRVRRRRRCCCCCCCCWWCCAITHACAWPDSADGAPDFCQNVPGHCTRDCKRTVARGASYTNTQIHARRSLLPSGGSFRLSTGQTPNCRKRTRTCFLCARVQCVSWLGQLVVRQLRASCAAAFTSAPDARRAAVSAVHDLHDQLHLPGACDGQGSSECTCIEFGGHLEFMYAREGVGTSD